MSQQPEQAPEKRPQLRLFQPEPGTEDGRVVSPRMTLSEFFEAWFLPVVLIGERDDSAATIVLYRDAIGWWKQLTGDPPVSQIDEFVLAEFMRKIRAATFKRSPLGLSKALSKATIAKHLRNLRAILYRVGPTTDAGRPAKRLIEETPRIRVAKHRLDEPKACFSIERARQIMEAVDGMTCPRRLAQVSAPAFWRAAGAGLFYTGLRAGTVLQLEWSMVIHRSDGPWLKVPGNIVDKTGKAILLSLHASCLRAFEAIRTSEARILPWPHCYEWFSEQHDRLQALAGIPEAQWLSPQAWRRTNGNELARRGAAIGLRIAQRALDHESVDTTRDSYVSLENELRRQLPEILPAGDQRQRLLF